MTQWVLEEACRQAKLWHSSFPDYPPLKMHVNLSAQYLAKGNLASEILGIIRKSGLDPSCFGLEITEEHTIRNPDQVSRFVVELSRAGIQTFIDDFGKGYSSLAYLSRLRAHGLKIDCAFVERLVDDPKNAATVRSVIALGQTLGLVVIAEGVETAEELEYLREVNCPYVQGFHVSMPVSAEEATHLLREPHICLPRDSDILPRGPVAVRTHGFAVIGATLDGAEPPADAAFLI